MNAHHKEKKNSDKKSPCKEDPEKKIVIIEI
jgi:hypothetical protein